MLYLHCNISSLNNSRYFTQDSICSRNVSIAMVSFSCSLVFLPAVSPAKKMNVEKSEKEQKKVKNKNFLCEQWTPTTKKKLLTFRLFSALFLATHSKRETRMYFIIIFPLYKLVSLFLLAPPFTLFFSFAAADYLFVAFVIRLRHISSYFFLLIRAGCFFLLLVLNW